MTKIVKFRVCAYNSAHVYDPEEFAALRKITVKGINESFTACVCGSIAFRDETREVLVEPEENPPAGV